MDIIDRIKGSFKYLDKNGLKHLVDKLLARDVHWTGTHAEYEAVKDTIPAYAILHFTDDYEDSVGVVDKVEDNNMNGVTSNAVYDAMNNVFVGTATKSAYVTEGSITWEWVGRTCRVLFENVRLAANTPFLGDICTGLPPANGTEFLTVCVENPTGGGEVGFFRTDRNSRKLQADAFVGGQTVEVTLFASVSYITSEPAHAI